MDVAKLAGVSHQTVSRVLNNHPSVRPATRSRVQSAIDQLGYRPSSAARTLATGHSSTFGILMVNGTSFGPSNLVVSIGMATQERGYFSSIAPVATFTAAATHQAIDQLVNQGVEGIVAVAPVTTVAQALDAYDIPCPIIINAARLEVPESSQARYVYIDQVQGTKAAIDHLIGLGHQKIWHIAGPDNWYDAIDRRETYVNCMTTAGYSPLVLPAAGWTTNRGYEVGKKVASAVLAKNGPTAVFSVNDEIAVGLYRALWEAGVQVPDDVSVVGFDDSQIANYLVPRLTTVRQPFVELGRASLGALIETLEHGGRSDLPRVAAVLEPELIVRDSVAQR